MTEPASSPPAVQPPAGVGHASSFKDLGHDPTAETSASRHGTHLAISAMSASSVSALNLPRCVWCGAGTGFYCEGWRPPIDKPYDTWRCVNPGVRSRAQDMVFGWECGEPVCTQCDRAFSCCMTCYCYKGGLSVEQAQNIHSELLQTHQGAGSSCFD